MSKHVGFPGERLFFDIKVVKIKPRDTKFGTVLDFEFITNEGNVLIWTSKNIDEVFELEQEYVIKGTVKTHDKDDDNVARTILLRVVESVRPVRAPRISCGTRGGSKTRMAYKASKPLKIKYR